MDPPYWETAGYGVDFGFDQYEELARIIGQIQGKAIISLNDHPDIRRVFVDHHIERADISYSCSRGTSKAASEIFIFSWNIQNEPSGLF